MFLKDEQRRNWAGAEGRVEARTERTNERRSAFLQGPHRRKTALKLSGNDDSYQLSYRRNGEQQDAARSVGMVMTVGKGMNPRALGSDSLPSKTTLVVVDHSRLAVDPCVAKAFVCADPRPGTDAT